MKDGCARRTELLMQYSTAVNVYSKLLSEIHDELGSIPHNEYEHLRRLAESARILATAARDVFEHHLQTHRC